jgi:hypothetical protein
MSYLALNIARGSLKSQCGHDVLKCSPMEAVTWINTPCLFIIGDKDELVDVNKFKKMVKNCATHYKKLIVEQGAGHPDYRSEEAVEEAFNFIKKNSKLNKKEFKIKNKPVPVPVPMPVKNHKNMNTIVVQNKNGDIEIKKNPFSLRNKIRGNSTKNNNPIVSRKTTIKNPQMRKKDQANKNKKAEEELKDLFENTLQIKVQKTIE